jgi:isoleucyl-tRNA synthetase
MNETIKTYIRSNPKYSICVIIGIVMLVAIGLFLWTRTDNHIDTTPIQNATRELDNSKQYNRQSIEYNQRIRDAVERSQVINERIEQTIDGSINANRRTTEAIDRSTELVKAARTDAANAKNLIRESQDILNAAKRDNQESTTESTTSQTH